MADDTIAERLEYLRGEIRAERISYSELAELQSLADHIAPGDVELAEWAGIPEDTPECLDDHDEGTCSGPVEYRSVPGGTAVPRCLRHFDERLNRYQNSIERYADSDVAPPWFDPSYAGERWEDD